MIGIDLGGTKVRAGIAPIGGEILSERRVPTRTHGVTVIETILALIDEVRESVGVDASQVIATGIGGAGVPNRHGSSFDQAPNVAGLDDTSFVEQLTRVLGHTVILENDVNIAALGELHYGVGRGESDFVFVSIGTGIGMGIVTNGGLLRGANGAAGEIGFLPLGADPLDPTNHLRGPLEESVAGDTIARHYTSRTGEHITTEEVFQRAADADADAIAVVEGEARWVAAALAAVHAVLDPGIAVLGGGIGSRADFLPRIRTWLERHGVTSLELRSSELGPLAPIAGAIYIAQHASTSVQKGHIR